MKRTEKDEFIGELQQKLEGASAFYLTDFTGLSVKQMTQFRARLRKQGVEYVVVKNTLAQRALQGLDVPDVAAFFTGPTGLVIGRDDAVAAAKALTDFAREFGDRPAVKVGVVERREVNADQVKKLAELPPREVLLAQIAGGLQAPMARLAGGMSQLLAGFARAVDALRQQKEGAGA
jgi:large subunit ribosomal protein L10